MKNRWFLSVLVSIMLMLAGCGSENKSLPQDSGQNKPESGEITSESANGVVEENDDLTLPSSTPVPEESGTDYLKEGGEGVDVDLTLLSSTMVFSEVYNMMVSPEDYMGKIIRMEGQYVPYHDDKTGKDYFACIIQDATACCSQGIEFDLTKDYSYPKDYPKEGDDICVTGRFNTYKEGDSIYSVLENATYSPA
ncbi:MAG: hypothetical protein K5639_02075 [Eubacterium sp.]|nr:hypothetical protein [Eubacterium sp.]